jgi:hypothetical protein
MLFAVLVAAALADSVPARWDSAETQSLELLRDTPVNCLLLEEQRWSAAFVRAAGEAGLATLAVIRPGGDTVAAAKRAAAAGFSGAVLEGAFDTDSREQARKALADAGLKIVELGPRSAMRFDSGDAVVGTNQGLWAGVRPHDESAKTGPTSAAWIDTNTGFLRYARAAAKQPVWIGHRPPAGTAYPVERYLQAVGDAASTGARWVVALDQEMSRKLHARDRNALAAWKRIADTLRYYEEHKEWRDAAPYGHLAIIENEASGALLSGGILDMIAVKHTPVRAVPPERLSESMMAGTQLAVNVDPEALSERQREVLRWFTRSGGTLLTGPPGWKFPAPRPGQITLEKEDLGKLDTIWRELNSLAGRKNLGARLFNVSTMMSNLLETRDRRQVILHLVNYADYPVENITVHVLGKYRDATLHQPGASPIAVQGYEIEEGTGYDIERVGSVATLVLAR